MTRNKAERLDLGAGKHRGDRASPVVRLTRPDVRISTERKETMKMTEAELLEHALVGYQAQRDEIQRRIDDVQRGLSGAAAEEEPRPKRRLSPEGRRRLIAATRKRWRLAKKAGRRTLG
jgi:hypothetical protein